MKNMTRIIALSIFMVLLSSALTFAQNFKSTLVGKVSDPTGAAIAGATVTVTHNDTNLTKTASTNGEGDFVVTSLQPGSYTVKIEANGFKIAVNTNIVLETDQTARLDTKLEVGSVNETVTVQDQPAVVNTETPEKGEVIVQRQVQELPLNVRDFTNLALLVPGVYQRPTDDDQGQGLAAAGTRTDASNFILDGVVNRSDRQGGVGVNTSVDSIQEFKVSTSTYSAEYGRVAGAQISVVSKSGTNRYSGSAFEFVRNDFFDARNYFLQPTDEKVLRRHQFGGTIGGPLPFFNFGKDKWFNSGKDKTFFFASFEQLREIRSQSAGNVVAPTEAWINGDFRAMRGPGNDKILGTSDDTGRVMCLQKGSNPLRPTRVECPTQNVIPLAPVASNPNLLYASPVSLAILKFLPVANSDGTYGVNVVSNILPRNLISLKIDRKLTEKNNFYFRVSADNRDAYQPQAGRVSYPGFLRNWKYRQYSYALGDTHAFSSTLVNDLRLGYLFQDNKILNENNDQDYVQQFGIPGLPTSHTPELQGFPAIRIDGFPDTGDSANIPLNFKFRNITIADALTWIVAGHTFKFGVDIAQPHYQEADIRNVRGDFRFRGRFSNPANAVQTGAYSFADFLYGIPDSTQRQIGGDAADLYAWQSAFYIQDTWRVRPWLTLNLGLRYDYTPFMKEKNNRISNFIPELGVTACASGAFNDPTSGAQICVDAASLGLPRALVHTDKNNLAPRFGFALKPFKDDKTVIRGGAGLFFSTETINPARQQLALNYPYIDREQYSRGSTADILQITFADPFPSNRISLQGVTEPLGIPTNAQTPEVYQFNLTLERELLSDLGFEIGYVGSQGRHLGMRYNLNYQYPTGAIATNGDPVTARVFPQFGDIIYQTQEVNSNYNALQAVLRRRTKNGLTLLMSYTFGKAMDQNSNTNNSTTGSQRNPQDIKNFKAEWALADYHRTQQFSASFNYDLPFGKGKTFFSGARGWRQSLLGDWQLNGIVTLLSGRPFTPVFATADTASGRPDLVSDPYQNIPDGLMYNPFAFAHPIANAADPTEFGTAGRNILIGPGYQDVDLSLFKNIRLAERMKLQLRWEVFNVLNHPNFQVPGFQLPTNVDQINNDPSKLPVNIGRPSLTSNEAREMQFAVRLIF